MAIGSAVMAFALAAACAPVAPPPGPNPDTAPAASDPRYLADGPDAVGITTLQLADRKVDVWYPAQPTAGPTATDDLVNILPANLAPLVPASLHLQLDLHGHRDATPLGDDHPLVLFAHGIFSWRDQSASLLAHLASWGFVVASPDFPEYGLAALSGTGVPFLGDAEAAMDRVVARLRSENTGAGLLAGQMNFDEVAVTGHSLGGLLATLYASRPFIKAYIPLASALVPASEEPDAAHGGTTKAAMWIRATTDATHADLFLPGAADDSLGPRAVVSIIGGGHVGPFSDLCDAGGVGVIPALASAGIYLPEQLAVVADDGCGDPNQANEAKVVGHFVTAELRWRLGLDPQPVGLGTGVLAHLPAAATYTHAP
jgi:dienelactone hydrolase